MGQRPGPSVSRPCATQYRSTSEKLRLVSCGLSYRTWSPKHAWCTSDRSEPPWSHDYQYLLSVHWLAASSKWTSYYCALIHYYVRQLTVFCTTFDVDTYQLWRQSEQSNIQVCYCHAFKVSTSTQYCFVFCQSALCIISIRTVLQCTSAIVNKCFREKVVSEISHQWYRNWN